MSPLVNQLTKPPSVSMGRSPAASRRFRGRLTICTGGAPKFYTTRPAPTRKRELTGNKDPEGGSDAHSGFGDFSDRDGFDSGTGSGADVRSGLSGLPARVRPGHLLRM